MNKLIQLFCVFPLVLVISACASVVEKHANNKPIRLIQKNEIAIINHEKEPDCDYLGEVIGTEGHWYNYLFISNRNLVQGALNDLYNNAGAMGANVVFISDDVSFSTSVTFYGQTYNCK